MDLSRERERDRLKPRLDCYWQRLADGAYLGFRRRPDTWHARFRRRDGKQQYQPLGKALECDDAKERAEQWRSQLGGSPVRSVKRATISSALDTYLEDLRRHDRAPAAEKAQRQFRAALGFDRAAEAYTDPLASLQLKEATQDDFLNWRDRLRCERLPRTVNRYVRALTAGPNRAHQLGHVGNPAASRMDALPENDEAETAVFFPRSNEKG